jgi:hypothetical protein
MLRARVVSVARRQVRLAASRLRSVVLRSVVDRRVVADRRVAGLAVSVRPAALATVSPRRLGLLLTVSVVGRVGSRLRVVLLAVSAVRRARVPSLVVVLVVR